MKESDLYLSVKQFLEKQNYVVKGEVQECDIMAIRSNEEPIIIELKLSLNLEVILQAVDRLAITSYVYIGIPRQNKTLERRRKQVIKLLRMLGIGLLVIDPTVKISRVDTLLDPGTYKPRKSKPRKHYLLREFVKRIGDPNLGGTDTRKGIMTAYRQKALAIAKLLQQNGPMKASHLAQILQEPKTRAILYNNHYDWFARIGRGIYELSPRGKREIVEWQKKVDLLQC